MAHTVFKISAIYWGSKFNQNRSPVTVANNTVSKIIEDQQPIISIKLLV